MGRMWQGLKLGLSKGRNQTVFWFSFFVCRLSLKNLLIWAWSSIWDIQWEVYMGQCVNIALNPENLTVERKEKRQCTVTTYVLPNLKWGICLCNSGLQTFGKKGKDTIQSLFNHFPRYKWRFPQLHKETYDKWGLNFIFHGKHLTHLLSVN